MYQLSHLDDRQQVLKIDQENILGSVEALGKQVQHAWEATQSLQFSPQAEIRNVVLAGMGGSGLGADVIKHIFKAELKIPFDYVNSYTLPGYVDQNSLVVLASYSGTTEEVLAAAEDAMSRQAQIMVIAAGGKLMELAEQHGWTAYRMEPTHNPSNQPRMAIGYAVFGTVALLAKAGVVKLTAEMVTETVAAIEKRVASCTPEVAAEQNPAKQLVAQLEGRRPIYVGAEFMQGSLHVSTNQANENAKVFADYKIVPEINHHLMEGLQFPESNGNTHLFIFAESDLYSARNQKRMTLTRQVVEQNKIPTSVLKLEGPSKLAQAFESMAILGFVGLYLSVVREVNPAPIPFVDWFKQELA